MSSKMAQPLARIIEHLKREPSRTGSIVITLFGDAIVPRGGSVWLGTLLEFFKTLENLLERALGAQVKLLRPFDRLQKTDVLRRGEHLPLDLTFSCIDPSDGLHCGRCNKCAERKREFRSAGIVDLTPYAIFLPQGA